MTAAVGFPTLRLIRTAIGQLALEEIPLGTWQELTPEKIRRIWQKR
jgi:23S rRNA pseudouridine2457 synthase